MDIKLKITILTLAFCQTGYANNVLYNEGKELCDKILEDLENLSNRQDIDEDEIEQARIFISRLKMRFQRPQSYTPLKKDIDISHIDADDIIERAESLPTVKTNIKKQSIDTLINDIHEKYSNKG